MPRPANNQSNKRRPQKRGGRKRSNSSYLPEGLPADVEEYGEDLAALEEADGEEINIGHLQKKDIAELNSMAKDMEVENFGTMRKHEMIFQILRKHAENRGVLIADGVLEILPEGFGFLRSPHYNICLARKMCTYHLRKSGALICKPETSCRAASDRPRRRRNSSRYSWSTRWAVRNPRRPRIKPILTT